MSSQSSLPLSSLRSALEALSADLAAPDFLRTTLSAEQLREVLRLRERDLSAAVGLARLLIGKDEERDQEMQQIAIDKDDLASVVASETIETLSNRCSRLEEELCATEVCLQKAQNSVFRLREDLESLKHSPSPEDSEQISQSEELLRSYCQELRTEERLNRRLERENEQLRKSASDLAASVARKTQAVVGCEGEVRRCRGKIRALSEENEALRQKVREAEDACKFLEFDLGLALRKAERMEEDLKLLLSSPTAPCDPSRVHFRHISFIPTLPEIEESDAEDPTQSSSRRGLSSDLGWETSDEDLFSLRKELFPASDACKNSFASVPGLAVEKQSSVWVPGGRKASRPYWGCRGSVVASFLRGRRVWGLVQQLWMLVFRFMRRPR